MILAQYIPDRPLQPTLKFQIPLQLTQLWSSPKQETIFLCIFINSFGSSHLFLLWLILQQQ